MGARPIGIWAVDGLLSEIGPRSLELQQSMWFWVPTVKITWEAIFVDGVGEYHAAKAWEEGHSAGESSSDCADTWQRCAEYFGGPKGTVQESAAGRCMVGSSVSQPVAEDAQQEQDSRAGFGRVGREAADSPAPDRTTPAAVAEHASVIWELRPPCWIR